MDAKSAERYRFLPTPAWLVYGAVIATSVLFAAERWRWFPVVYQKGWPVLLAMAVVVVVLILLPAWMLVGLAFRRRVQFGLRTMLVFVTLCAMVCSWLAVRLRDARRQANVFAAIQKKRLGMAAYDWQMKCGHVRFDCDEKTGVWSNTAPPPPVPESLTNLLGVDFFANVDTVWLSGSGLTDAALADIEVFTRLRMLDLRGGEITDMGLTHVGRLTNLQTLDLDCENITDAGLTYLESSPNLRTLRLSRTTSTRDGPRQHGTKVTDEGTSNLRRFLPECKITVE